MPKNFSRLRSSLFEKRLRRKTLVGCAANSGADPGIFTGCAANSGADPGIFTGCAANIGAGAVFSDLSGQARSGGHAHIAVGGCGNTAFKQAIHIGGL